MNPKLTAKGCSCLVAPSVSTATRKFARPVCATLADGDSTRRGDEREAMLSEAAPGSPAWPPRSDMTEPRPKRRRAGGLTGQAAVQARGEGESRRVGTPCLLVHRAAATQLGLEKAGSGAAAGANSVAPRPHSMLGPRALPHDRALFPRRLRIADQPDSPTPGDHRDCLSLLQGGLRPHVPSPSEAAADDTAEAWPPPPIRTRLAVHAQRIASRRRRRGRLSASTPAVSNGSGVVVDYAHALRFIMRVKSTCASECFPAFLDILLEYHSGRRTVFQVYEEASALFAVQDRGEEVLAAFKDFLPIS